jgi:hypothetical protein
MLAKPVAFRGPWDPCFRNNRKAPRTGAIFYGYGRESFRPPITPVKDFWFIGVIGGQFMNDSHARQPFLFLRLFRRTRGLDPAREACRVSERGRVRECVGTKTVGK